MAEVVCGVVAQMSDSATLRRDRDEGGNSWVEKDMFHGHLNGYLSELVFFSGIHKMPKAKLVT